jgi:hypothetical protein
MTTVAGDGIGRHGRLAPSGDAHPRFADLVASGRRAVYRRAGFDPNGSRGRPLAPGMGAGGGPATEEGRNTGRTGRSLVVTVVLASALVALPSIAAIGVEVFALADGTQALAFGGRLYLPGPTGVLAVAGDGNYALKHGGRITVKNGKLDVPPWVRKGFDPQPEPPGFALRGALLDGRRIEIVGGKPFLLVGTERRACPDGTYRLAGGANARVVGGQRTGLSSLAGLTAGEQARFRAIGH